MKRNLFLTIYILLLVMITSEIMAQKLVIRMNNGDENIETLSTIRKIYFSDNDMVVDFFTGSDDIYAIGDVRKLYFDSMVAVEDNPESKDGSMGVYPNPADDFIIVHGIPPSAGKISVYAADGRLVLSKDISSGRESINISGLHPGLYVVGVPGYTTKFVKQ